MHAFSKVKNLLCDCLIIVAPTSAAYFHLQGDNQQFELPAKEKTDICTIMYTSGTTGDPKGVMISNESIVTLIAGVKRLLESVNEKVRFFQFHV